jgi:hypothetical protein
MQKVFVTADNTATFTCPDCERSRTVDVTQYRELDRAVKIKVKCPCGFDYIVGLERRRQFRKAVRLSGTFQLVRGGRSVARGEVEVVDLSRTGVKLRLERSFAGAIGDRVHVAFRLDDAKRSDIQLETIVRKVDGRHVGVEFTDRDPSDPNMKAIGFYLFG